MGRAAQVLLAAWYCLVAGLLPASAHARSSCLLGAELGGVVNTGTAQYLQRALEEAERRNCALLVAVNSPGGGLEATRSIVQAFLGARVPVIAYVRPSGARAGSAAMFVTLAAHVALMAPGTNIGAAHPVSASGGDPEDSVGEVMARKVVNDTAAFARAIAETRGRNADWAGKAVRDSESLTASEAVDQDVVDAVVPNLPAALRALDGRSVELGGRSMTLRTAELSVEPVERTIQERTLALLGHPSVAYALLSLGMLGITVELLSPGTLIAGGLGIVCLLLGAIGINFLPVNVGALLLLAAAGAMFVAEVYVTSYGLLALGGVVLMLTGSALLIDRSDPGYFVDRSFGVSWGVIVPLTTLLLVSVVGLGWMVRRSSKATASTGKEGMIGRLATALTRIDSREGNARVDGERWHARSAEPIQAGTQVRVVDIEGLTLRVVAAEHGRRATSAPRSRKEE